MCDVKLSPWNLVRMKQTSRLRARPKPNYGLDLPRRVRLLFAVGASAILAGFLLPWFDVGDFHITLVGPTLLALGSLSLGICASMTSFSLRRLGPSFAKTYDSASFFIKGKAALCDDCDLFPACL